MKKTVCLIVLLCCIKFLQAQTDALQAGQVYSSSFTIDGIARNITYYMPANYGKKDAYGLIVFLHAANSSAKNFIKTYGDIISAKADSADCIIMYPDAVAGKWDDGLSKFSLKDSVNDAGFVGIMIDYFVQVYHTDPKRVFVAGIENGGFMAERCACNISAKISAFAALKNEDDRIKSCSYASVIAAMDTKNISLTLLQKLDRNTLYDVIDFLLAHPRN